MSRSCKWGALNSFSTWSASPASSALSFSYSLFLSSISLTDFCITEAIVSSMSFSCWTSFCFSINNLWAYSNNISLCSNDKSGFNTDKSSKLIGNGAAAEDLGAPSEWGLFFDISKGLSCIGLGNTMIFSLERISAPLVIDVTLLKSTPPLLCITLGTLLLPGDLGLPGPLWGFVSFIALSTLAKLELLSFLLELSSFSLSPWALALSVSVLMDFTSMIFFGSLESLLKSRVTIVLGLTRAICGGVFESGSLPCFTGERIPLLVIITLFISYWECSASSGRLEVVSLNNKDEMCQHEILVLIAYL